eukprot:15006933-Alexandrium_andersonii.AAC.1
MIPMGRRWHPEGKTETARSSLPHPASQSGPSIRGGQRERNGGRTTAETQCGATAPNPETGLATVY